MGWFLLPKAPLKSPLSKGGRSFIERDAATRHEKLLRISRPLTGRPRLPLAAPCLPGRISPHSYWLTRFIILRLLGLVYFVAFLSLAQQILPLIGSQGLLPVELFLPPGRKIPRFAP